MTYKLESWIEKIESPVVLLLNGERIKYQSGTELSSAVFDRRYLISTIKAENHVIVINLNEAEPMNGDASFF